MSNWKRTENVMPEPLTDVLCMSRLENIFYGYYVDTDDTWRTVETHSIIGGGRYVVAWCTVPKYDLEDE